MEKVNNVKTKSKKSHLILFTFLLVMATLLSCYLLVGLNTKILVIPTIVFTIFFIISLLSTIFVTEGEDKIILNIDSGLIVGLAVIAAIAKSPLSFVIAISVLLIVPQNIKDSKWNYLFLNYGTMVLSACVTLLTLQLLNINMQDSLILVIIKILSASLAFNFSNYFILAFSYIAERKKWKEIKVIMVDSQNALSESVALSIGCGLLGYFYFQVGSIVLAAYLLPLIVGPLLFSSYSKMSKSQDETIHTLIYALEEKDPYTAGHVERVAMFAEYIGEELNYKPYKQKRLYQAALLHDTGKLIVPTALLNKPGKLTDAEYVEIKKHEGVTEEILSNISFLKPIAHTAGGDHNKMNDEAKKNKLEAYIVAVCDAFDAMTSTRSYRKALTQKEAFEELRKCSGKQFHPIVVDKLISAIEKRDEHYGSGYEENIIHENAPVAGVGSAGIGDTIKEGDENES